MIISLMFLIENLMFHVENSKDLCSFPSTSFTFRLSRYIIPGHPPILSACLGTYSNAYPSTELRLATVTVSWSLTQVSVMAHMSILQLVIWSAISATLFLADLGLTLANLSAFDDGITSLETFERFRKFWRFADLPVSRWPVNECKFEWRNLCRGRLEITSIL